MLYRLDARICVNVYALGMVPMVSKDVGKAFMSEAMTQAASVVGGSSNCSNYGPLKA